MKRNVTTAKNQKVVSKKSRNQIWKAAAHERLTIGLDLGDRSTRYCILSEAGQITAEGELPTRQTGFQAFFEKMPPSLIALEVGTHSPWISRQLASYGHEVIVANTRKVRLIAQSTKKDDRLDAALLARLARVDPRLLSPIQHRSAEAQMDLTVIRARETLVEARTKLIVSARGLAKTLGCVLPCCETEQVTPSLAADCPAEVQSVLAPLLQGVEGLSVQIARHDEQIGEMQKKYPETQLLQQVYGVGPIVALAYVLIIDNPERFQHSRTVGAYVGLRPKKRRSGASDPQLGISKEGDPLLRSLLVQAAHCTLRRGAPDSDLRAWGLMKLQVNPKEANSNGKKNKNLKKKVVVAIARKLAVLLHRLWSTGEVYDPFYNRKQQQKRAVAA